MSIAQQVHEWLQLVNPGEEVTTTMMRDIIPEATSGAISAALAAFSLCDPPLIELVARRRQETGGVAYVYARTEVAIRLTPFTRRIHGHGSGPNHKSHEYRGANLPMESEK